MDLFYALLLALIVLFGCAWICYETGRKTEAKWLLGIGIGALLLLWTLLKVIIEVAGKNTRKRPRND